MLPYLDGASEVVFSEFALQTELKSSALEYFEEMKVKLLRSDLYNNAAYVLNDTYIEYSSDKPKRLNVTFTCLLSIATSQLCKPRTKSKIKNYKQRCLLSPFMFLGRVLSHLAGLLFHPFLGATRWML